MEKLGSVTLSGWQACTQVVEAVSKSCSTANSNVLSTNAASGLNNPNWDATASSFAALSVALTWGSIILAVFAVIGGLAWGWIISKKAETEAKEEAKRCSEMFVKKWLADEAPGIIRTHIDNLQNSTLGGGDEGDAADAMGRAAG